MSLARFGKRPDATQYLIMFTIIFLSFVASRAEAPRARCDECLKLDALITAVRDGRASKNTIGLEITAHLSQIATWYYRSGGEDCTTQSWAFPFGDASVAAYAEIDRQQYKPFGYDFFHGNKHGGHPAYDIFVKDDNQDGLFDETKTPATVVSVTGGVVVSVYANWTPESTLRGGNYIWIYDPASQMLVYYAHNADVFVRPGDMVRPGDRIASVGRTGLNAIKKRSPTHLHLMFLRISGDRIRPWDSFNELIRLRTKARVKIKRGTMRFNDDVLQKTCDALYATYLRLRMKLC